MKKGDFTQGQKLKTPNKCDMMVRPNDQSLLDSLVCCFVGCLSAHNWEILKLHMYFVCQQGFIFIVLC